MFKDRPDISGLRWVRARKPVTNDHADLYVGAAIVAAALLLVVLSVLGK